MPNCSVPLCTNRSENCNFSFFRYPQNKAIRQKWLETIRRLDFVPNDNHRVCSWHFPNGKENGPTRFHWTEEVILSPGKKKMRRKEKKLEIPTDCCSDVPTVNCSKALEPETPYGVEIFVSMEDFDKLDPADVKSGPDKLEGTLTAPRKVVEILCFDGQQYRYIYRGADSVCSVKLEIQGGVELFVSMEDFDKLEPADVKPSPHKLLDLIVPDLPNDAKNADIVPSPKQMLSELTVKEECSPFLFLATSFVAQGSNSDAESVEDDKKVLPDPCTNPDSYGTEKVRFPCRTSNQVYCCSICNVTFEEKGQLQRHQTVHFYEDPFKCHLCSKTFKKRANLGEHVKVHASSRSFYCSYCWKIFRLKKKLKDHKCMVRKKGTFICDICAHDFVTKQDLKSHLLLVHNEKTFVCEVQCTPDLMNT